MKLNLINTNLVIKTAKIITKTLTYTSTEGATINILFDLDYPMAPDTTFKIKVEGDEIVDSNGLNIYYGGVYSQIKLNTEYTFQTLSLAPTIRLSRSISSATGTVTVSLEYSYIEYDAVVSVTNTLNVVNGAGTITMDLGTERNWVYTELSDASHDLNVVYINSNNTTIYQNQTNSYAKYTYYNADQSFRYIRFYRDDTDSTLTFDIDITLIS